MDALWDEYHGWLRTRFAPRVEEAAGPKVEGEVLARAFSVFSPVLDRGGARWYVQSDGYTRPRLMRQAAGGAAESVREVEFDTRLAAAAGYSILLSEPEISRNHHLLYDLFPVAP